MSEYVFTPGQPVVVVRDGRVSEVLTVLGQEQGVVTTDDGEHWYAASGLPVSGSSRRRLTALTAPLERQLERRRLVTRLVELAVLVAEESERHTIFDPSDLERAVGALRHVLRARAAAMRPSAREAFWRRVDERLEAAAEGVVGQMRVG